jgi:hypothetical protein
VGVTKEIERKFLVEDLSNLRNLPFYDIRQGYFEHKRLRERVSNCLIPTKFPLDRI